MIAATSIEHLSKNELFDLLKDLHVESVRIDKNIEQIKQTLELKISSNKMFSNETVMESSLNGGQSDSIYLKVSKKVLTLKEY